MRLLKLYKDILESLNVYSDDVGLLSHRRPDGQVEQISVSVEGQGKRLVLPEPDLLRKGLPDELVVFHPLSEVSNRTESEVFRKLKLMVNLRLTTVLTSMLEDLVELAADKDRRKGLPAKLLTLLEALPHADAKLVSNMKQLIGASLAGGKNRLINIYMNRGGKHMGEKHARLAVISFPILAELDDPDRKVYGVQLRAKDVPQIKALFEWILPNCDQVGTYNACSDSMDAPYFEALMLAYVKLSRQFNSIQKISSKYLDDAAFLKTDIDWVSELADIDKMRHEIPPLDGNKGIGMGNGKSEGEAPAPKTALDAMQSRMSTPEPVRISTPPVTAPAATAPVCVLDEEPTSSITPTFTSSELRRMNQPAIRPIVTAAAVVDNGPRPRDGLRKMSEILGPSVQPIAMNYGQPNGYAPNPGYAQPNGYAPNPGYAHPNTYGPAPGFNRFAAVNVAASNPGNNNGGWGSGTGWSGGSRF